MGLLAIELTALQWKIIDALASNNNTADLDCTYVLSGGKFMPRMWATRHIPITYGF